MEHRRALAPCMLAHLILLSISRVILHIYEMSSRPAQTSLGYRSVRRSHPTERRQRYNSLTSGQPRRDTWMNLP